MSREAWQYIFGALCVAILIAYAKHTYGACDRNDLWVNLGGRSYHAERDREHREANWGLGFRGCIDDNADWTVGYYRNSLDRNTFYAAIPLSVAVSSFKLGIAPGLVMGGYQSPIIPVALPFASIQFTSRFALSTLYVPKLLANEEVWFFRFEWRIR